MPVLIGTSGWHYQHWKGGIYPASLPSREWLRYYAERFETVELNNAFYRLPSAEMFSQWASATPAGFVVAVKASRYLTHIKRLKDPAEPVGRLMERAGALGDRLGPVLLQLPPNLRADHEALDKVLQRFPSGVRVAVEARHSSWCSAEVRSVLEHRGAAWCMADGGPIDIPRWRTAEWGYVRFHSGGGRPPSCYTRSPLDTWARRLAELYGSSSDLYCYFNNDAHGCAPRDARWFAAAVQRAGLAPTRVPGRRETPVPARPS
ncbi:MAG: DUF72 domain-containing protein [Acidimicrobiales bacterium]|nr:DUF72 domain-containing protein [Acidimicrobiales bacterium]